MSEPLSDGCYDKPRVSEFQSENQYVFQIPGVREFRNCLEITVHKHSWGRVYDLIPNCINKTFNASSLLASLFALDVTSRLKHIVSTLRLVGLVGNRFEIEAAGKKTFLRK